MSAVGGVGGGPDWAEAAAGGDDAAHAALPFGRGASTTEIGPGRGKLPEPSGIVFHPQRGTLFVVGDRGHVVEMTREGRVLRKERVHEYDLEGVTVGPKGRIYAVNEERPPKIIELDPDTLEVRRTFKIEKKDDGRRVIARHANQGVEGLCWVEEDQAFYALNQDRPPAIVRLDVPLGKKDGGEAKIDKVIGLEKAVDNQASDLMYDPVSRHFLVTESGGDHAGSALHEMTRHGKLVRTLPLEGDRPEGLALDDRGSAFLAQDGGRVLRVDPK